MGGSAPLAGMGQFGTQQLCWFGDISLTLPWHRAVRADGVVW